MSTEQWLFESDGIDWQELSDLYRIAPLGNKSAEHLRLVYANSRFKCFVLEDGKLIGAGRALADGRDCSYLCDIVVHPDRQGQGLGKALVAKLTELSVGHRKIILYANPGKEGFYKKLGFRRMLTAMAKFQDQQHAIGTGLVADD
jgi:ribosomal protein S18 acetylase RimI-like enzyme